MSLQEYQKLQTEVEELERLLKDHGINRTATVAHEWHSAPSASALVTYNAYN